MARKLTMGSLIKTVQGCDGYSMDLDECAEHYGVTEEALLKFIEDGPTWLVVEVDEDGDRRIACDGE